MGLVDYDSSSSSDKDIGILKKKLKQSPHTPYEESEVSSSVVQEDPKERTNRLTQNPATMLLEMGCSFEQILHAISLCGQETQVEDLFDFIQACECSLEEDRNAVQMPVHAENAPMQEALEPCLSLRMHVTDSCGSEEKEKFVMSKEDRNAVEMPVHEENAWMQEALEPCTSLRTHITYSCGSEEKEKFVMQTQGYAGEASCSRSPRVC